MIMIRQWVDNIDRNDFENSSMITIDRIQIQ